MSVSPQQVGPLRVLIAEDEWIVAAALRRQVEGLGYQVVGTVGTGAKAVEVCGQEHPDVVLMDLQMPDMDGVTATRRLMENCPHPVVVVTGHGDLEEQAEEAGAMEFVLKPLLQSQIPGILARVQQRFSQYLQVHGESASCPEALECWHVVQQLLRRLQREEELSEEEAFARLRSLAAQAGRTLHAQAGEMLRS